MAYAAKYGNMKNMRNVMAAIAQEYPKPSFFFFECLFTPEYRALRVILEHLESKRERNHGHYQTLNSGDFHVKNENINIAAAFRTKLGKEILTANGVKEPRPAGIPDASLTV